MNSSSCGPDSVIPFSAVAGESGCRAPRWASSCKGPASESSRRRTPRKNSPPLERSARLKSALSLTPNDVRPSLKRRQIAGRRPPRRFVHGIACLDRLGLAAFGAFERLYVGARSIRRQPYQRHVLPTFRTERGLDRCDTAFCHHARTILPAEKGSIPNILRPCGNQCSLCNLRAVALNHGRAE